MKPLSYGDAALLLDCESLDEARAWYAALRRDTDDAVLGARSVLLRGKPAELRQLVAATTPAAPDLVGERPAAQIDVRYDGPDLAEVASLTNMTTTQVIAAHTGTPWQVAFSGFAPGFAYLTGGDPGLVVPRRSSPRTHIPAGSVGLAGEYSGVYPSDSPGGWQIIGHTSATLWDTGREPPALLLPGHTVKFVEAP